MPPPQVPKKLEQSRPGRVFSKPRGCILCSVPVKGSARVGATARLQIKVQDGQQSALRFPCRQLSLVRKYKINIKCKKGGTASLMRATAPVCEIKLVMLPV